MDLSSQPLQFLEMLRQRCQPGKAASPAGSRQSTALVMRLQDARLLLDTSLAAEILRVRELKITPVPQAKPWLLGLVSVRSQLLSLIDLQQLLLNQPCPSRQARVIVTKRPWQVALMVPAVSGIRPFGEAQRCDMERIDPGLRPFIKRCVDCGPDLAMELDLERLFDNPEFHNAVRN